MSHSEPRKVAPKMSDLEIKPAARHTDEIGPLSDDEKNDVTLLCFAEVIVCTLVNRAKPKTRRYNKLMTTLDNIQKADETYRGYIPEEYRAKAEKILGDVEASLLGLFEEDKNE